MVSSHIVRIPRTDEEGSFILGEVTPSGSKPLNVKFVATEGEEPYVVKLRHDRVGELRASTSPCTPEEWENILKALLFGGEPIDGIEAGAEANVGKSITITIRRRVAGISQRLGALTLKHKADEAIQLFDWCGAAALQREQLQETAAAEKAKVSELESRIAELKGQLDELIELKKAKEAEMLEKFCGLLNEKKVKIREQQRLLSIAQVDHSKLDEVRASQATGSSITEGRNPAPSRRAKRKALEDASGGGSSDSDDAFEKVTPAADRMDVDQDDEPPSGSKESPESEDQETTDGNESETASEPEEEQAPPPSPPKARQARKSEPKSRAAAASKAKKGKDVVIHPPKRPARKAKAATPPPAEGSETESDDEL